MKKWISLLLTILMIFSCMNVAVFAEEEEEEDVDRAKEIAEMVGVDFTYALENPDLSTVVPSAYLDAQGQYDIEQLLASDDLQNVDFLGLNLNFMYKSQDQLSWTKISFSRSDLALIYGNINSYLSSVMKSKLLKGKNAQYTMYTSANATRICNYIGHLFFPDYEDQTISFSSEPTTTNNFYKTIASRSGFQNLIRTQWLNQPELKFRPLLYALGFDFAGLYAPDEDLKSSVIISARLIKNILEDQIINEGPYAYLMTVIKRMSYTYDLYLYDSVKALFANQIQANRVSASDLRSLRTLFNLVFNFNDPTDTTRLQFITPPTYRFIMARDDSELFLYLLTYLNLVGIYKNNPNVINKLKEIINSNAKLSNQQKSRINTIIAATFESKIADLAPLNEELTYEAIDGIGDNLKNGILGFFGRILNMITSLFDTLFKRIRSFV